MFDKFADKVSNLAGTSGAFALAIVTIIIWLITGPMFHFDNTWQLLINTPTTIVTFLLMFVIQRTQIKATLAQKVQLNELTLALNKARNFTIDLTSKTLMELSAMEKDQIIRAANTLQGGTA